MSKGKNVNSGIFAILVTIGFLLLVLVTVLILATRESKEKTSAIRIVTPEALDPEYYVNGSKVMAEDLSYAENEELLENYK